MQPVGGANKGHLFKQMFLLCKVDLTSIFNRTRMEVINIKYMDKQNGFSQTAVVGIIVGVLVLGAVVWAVAAQNNKQDDAMMMEDKMDKNDGAAMMDDQNKPSDSMMKEEDKMMEDKMEGDAMMHKPGAYKDYSAATVEAEQQAGNKVVLFFHATWCPECKAANAAFLSRVNDIPAGVTLLKVDYDSNIALRQKYGVTYQHTFVQIDSNENQVSKWNGGDIDNLKKYVK